jgi:hypothetical protein
MNLKHWLETQEICYYRRYVDDILIIYDRTKIDVNTIAHHLNNFNKDLTFIPTLEENNSINYLNLTIHRTTHNLQLGIYRKPTHTDTTIHFASTCPLQHKLAAYRFYINRMLTLSITNTEKMKEWNTIQNIAHNNGFSPNLIHKLRYKLENAPRTREVQPTTRPRAWVNFTSSNPAVHKITNLFKNTGLNIAFGPSNTIDINFSLNRIIIRIC